MKYDIISINDPLPILGAIKLIIKDSFDVLRGRKNIHGELKI
jgi:hypothetical protein